MIRGAIEVVGKTRVAGWVHAGTESLRGRVVLAFVGTRCVGSGEAGGFRQDLLDAGLGDGCCGFDFPVRLNDGEHVGSLIVRLQFSDAALLQPGSRVVGPGGDEGAMQPGRVAWMMDRGMLNQVEYDCLTALAGTGAYVRSLRVGKPGSDAAGQRTAPEIAVAELLGLVLLGEVQVERTRFAALTDIATLPPQPAPVFALWSQGRYRLTVEGRTQGNGAGQGGPVVLAEPPAAGTDHDLGPDRLLFLHRDCRLAARSPPPSAGFVVLTATPVSAAEARPQTVLAA